MRGGVLLAWGDGCRCGAFRQRLMVVWHAHSIDKHAPRLFHFLMLGFVLGFEARGETVNAPLSITTKNR